MPDLAKRQIACALVQRSNDRGQKRKTHSTILTVCVNFREASWELEAGLMTNSAVNCSTRQEYL